MALPTGAIGGAGSGLLIIPGGTPGPTEAFLPVSQGTFTLNGTTAVTVTNAAVTANSLIPITLKTVGGTVGAVPAIQTITAATGFTVAGTASDTSVYNYAIIG
jgi:hypothetical protein